MCSVYTYFYIVVQNNRVVQLEKIPRKCVVFNIIVVNNRVV